MSTRAPELPVRGDVAAGDLIEAPLHATAGPGIAPTLIVTAGTVTPRVEALGAEAILRKPVSLRRLVDTIRRFC